MKQLSLFILLSTLLSACTQEIQNKTDYSIVQTIEQKDTVETPKLQNIVSGYSALSCGKVIDSLQTLNPNYFNANKEDLWDYWIITEPVSDSLEWYYIYANSFYPTNEKGNIGVLIVPKDTTIFKYCKFEENGNNDVETIETVKKIGLGLYKQNNPALTQLFNIFLLFDSSENEIMHTQAADTTIPFRLYQYEQNKWNYIANVGTGAKTLHQESFDLGEYILKKQMEEKK